MPALLHTRCTAPKRATAASARACTLAASPTPVRTVSTSAPAPRPGWRGGRDAVRGGWRCPACGAPYLGHRIACSKCAARGRFEEVPLSRHGTLWVYPIVHQSSPGVPVPYVVGVVDLPEGVSV